MKDPDKFDFCYKILELAIKNKQLLVGNRYILTLINSVSHNKDDFRNWILEGSENYKQKTWIFITMNGLKTIIKISKMCTWIMWI